MLNKIIGFSLKNRILVLFITGIIFIIGTIITINSEVDVFPDLNAPTVVVMTEAPGYAPEEIEKSVVFPIETAVNGATGVRRVRSSISQGFSVVWVEFDWGTDIYKARQIVSEKLSTIADAMPQGVATPTLGPQSSILGEMYIIGLTADSIPLMDIRTFADKTLRPRLLSVGGVSQVTVMGGDVKEYQIQIDPAKMKHYNVTISDVLNASSNINNNVGGGSLYEFGNEYIIKGDISTDDVEAIGLGVIKRTESGIVLIQDVATVTIGGKVPKIGIASEKCKPAVLLTITKQPNVDTNKLTEAIDNEMEKVSKTLPKGINVSTDIFRQADFINSSISNIQKALLEGAIFVIVVLFFFLMNIRTTMISLIALPLSIIISIVALHFMGYTLNTMSLGGIAIAIGSLVDDAIVDVENVYKRLRYNKSLPAEERKSILDVVYHASAEVRMPIFNSSLIIVASFLPLFFLSGIEGRLLIPLGISFIVALFASTIVALTLTPVLCSYLLGAKKDNEKNKDSWITSHLKANYEKGLNWSLNHKRFVLSGITLLFIGAIIGLSSLGRSFLPSFNEGSFTINVSTLPGVSLAVSDEIGRKAEEVIMSIPEIKTVARKTGRAELDEHSRGVNASEFEAPYVIKDRSRNEILDELRHKLSDIPGTNIEIGQPISHRIDAMLSGTKAQIAIKLFGDDLNQLYKTGSEIKTLVSSIPDIVDVNIEQQISRPELIIKPRRELLARYGITLGEFNQYIDVVLAGRRVSQVYENGYPFDLTVISDENSKDGIEKIKNLMIDSNIGKIPLEYIAEVISSEGPNSISRENVSRRIIVSANVSNSDLRGAVEKIQNEIEQNIKLPKDYHISYGGQFESEAQASRTLAITSCLALLIVFLLLYHEFKDIKESLIILINLPLAMIGGVFILLFTGGELNIPAIIGFISLLGITTRNGMLLISRYMHLKEEGHSLIDRIKIGSIDRLNPIIMTALTSALAMIPLAVNGSAPGNEIQSPMATVILGGLITSTVLNIFVVPILYYLINIKKEVK
ncbi:MAG: efflux RND transporter permease subunit [Muribaculaceae bacterium]|nr:efflux RND transporter permease subunit [Muribaculaceae bacterium]